MSATELAWFKSSHSGTQGDDCVEVAATEQAVHVRDSKDATGPHLSFDRAEWVRFLQYVAGE